MAWTVVEVEGNKKCRGTPAASIGYGRLLLNVAACNLLDHHEKYKYAELLTDTLRPSAVGVRLLEDSTEKAIAIKRKTNKGKVVGGIEIPSKYHMQKLFGIKGTQKKITTYSVTKDKQYENILIITEK